MIQGRIRNLIHAFVLVFAMAAMLPAMTVQAEPAKPAAAAVNEPVNINTASAELLADRLQGVGPAKAEAIVAYRTQFGAFESVEELLEVKGIGPALLKQNQGSIVLK